MTYLFSLYWYCWFHPHSEGEAHTQSDDWHHLDYISYRLSCVPKYSLPLAFEEVAMAWEQDWFYKLAKMTALTNFFFFLNSFVPSLTYLLIFIVCLAALLLQLGGL